MLKIYFQLFLLFLAEALSLSFSSCEEANSYVEANDVEPTVVFSFGDGFLPYVSNGEMLSIGSLSIDTDKSSKGVYIKLVNYYFDDEMIASATSSPFALNHLIKDKSVGDHKLSVVVLVSGDGYMDAQYTMNFTIHVLKEPFALDCVVYYDNNLDADNPTVSNDEAFSGHIELAENNTVKFTITKVEYYWDNNLFETSSVAPFTFSYAVNDETKGNHTFKYDATASSDYGEIYYLTGTKTVLVK